MVCTSDSGKPFGMPVGVIIGLIVLLLAFSGIFSGLTLGLMSLDRLNLQVSETSGEPNERKWAKAIRPLRDQGNVLLCTLLLGNTLVNSAISILLDSVSNGGIAVVLSTLIILVFGEILPQAVCFRFGLAVGAVFKPLVYFFMLLFYPLTWPISKMLDLVLGRDIGMVYNKQELKQLITLHYEDPEANKECGLTYDDQKIIQGAFEFKDKVVRDVMTHTDKVFMLEISSRLSPTTMLQIYRMGFTRIPVYQEVRENIVGILYTKDLILIDPDDDVELSTIIAFRNATSEEGGKYEAMQISEETNLDEVLKIFKLRCSHMLFAKSRDHGVTTGLITLEDVLEEVLKDEIIDESDNVVDTNHPERPMLQKKRHEALSRFLQNAYLPSSEQFTPEEASAVVAYLIATTNEFKLFKECSVALMGLITNHASIIEIGDDDDADSLSSHLSSMDHTNNSNSRTILYEQGKTTDTFTLILQGKVLIESGLEKFQLELGPWSRLSEKALSTDLYTPDFTALVTSNQCRLLQISKSAYMAAVHAAKFEMRVGKLAVKKEVLLHLGKSFGPATNDSAASSDDDGEEDSPGGSQDEIELTLL
jgi:metal transporter CNNM